MTKLTAVTNGGGGGSRMADRAEDEWWTTALLCAAVLAPVRLANAKMRRGGSRGARGGSWFPFKRAGRRAHVARSERGAAVAADARGVREVGGGSYRWGRVVSGWASAVERRRTTRERLPSRAGLAHEGEWEEGKERR